MNRVKMIALVRPPINGPKKLGVPNTPADVDGGELGGGVLGEIPMKAVMNVSNAVPTTHQLLAIYHSPIHITP